MNALPTFNHRTVFELTKNLKVALDVSAQVVRGKIPAPAATDTRGTVPATASRPQLDNAESQREQERLRRQLESRVAENARLKAQLSADGAKPVVDPESMVWMLGTGRTGSTWLSFMMGDMEGMSLWPEPLVGELFGAFYYRRAGETQRGRDSFILSRSRKVSWLNSIRAFVLSEAADRFPGLAGGGHLVIAEPNGSIGAPLLMQALPESRMILLIRDPRDVAASSLDAHKEGGWAWTVNRNDGKGGPKDPDVMVERTARKYAEFVGSAREAYETHEGPKVLVRYEDLRVETADTMRRICSTLGLPYDHEDLTRVVEKHAWEAIPAEKKGPGKPQRRATPGGWREDLSPKQAEIVERETAPLLEEFYSA